MILNAFDSTAQERGIDSPRSADQVLEATQSWVPAMSWPTIIWSMVGGASLMMALPHLIAGLSSRSGREHLFFALAAAGVAGLAAAELFIMHSTTVEESGRALQMAHVPVVVLVIGIVGFIRFSFGTGLLWLGVVACVLRVVCLILNFAYPPNFNFREITELRSFQFLGDTITMPVGPQNSWVLIAYVSSLCLLVYTIDASRKLWRKGGPDQRQRAVVVGASIVVFILISQGIGVLINAGLVDLPFLVSMPFMAIVVAMGFELSRDLIRSAQLSRVLTESEERMSLAAESARLVLWEWDFVRDQIWTTNEGRKLLNLGPDERITFSQLSERVHPEDRESREAAIRHAVATGGSYEMEYRLVMADESVRWIAARGRCVGDRAIGTMRLLGVSIDITQQKRADVEMRQQREELGHLARVTMVGEMAASLAHEVNQPLASILMNAAAGQRYLSRGDANLEELREILADIAGDARRAGGVVRSIRGMVRKDVSQRHAVDLNEVIANILRLVRIDALAHGCTLVTELESKLPHVLGDVVQLQQVLLNLVLNAFDAMRASPAELRRLEISSRIVDADTVEVSVRDFGPGLPSNAPQRVFEPFFSTKREGMGMGLSIARSIIQDHRGTLDAENVTARSISPTEPATSSDYSGARFWFRLPVLKEASPGAEKSNRMVER